MAQEWGIRPWDLEQEIEKDPSLDLWIARKTLWDNTMSNRQDVIASGKQGGTKETIHGNTKKTVIR